jgi:hypothetical protein
MLSGSHNHCQKMTLDFSKRHYNTQTRDALPAMRWDRIELVTDLLTSIGLSDVTVIDLAEVGLLTAQQANPHQWFIVTGRQGR